MTLLPILIAVLIVGLIALPFIMKQLGRADRDRSGPHGTPAAPGGLGDLEVE